MTLNLTLDAAALHNRDDSALLNNLVLFGRVLHRCGLDVNPGRMIDAASALGHVDIGNKSDFYHALRGVLVHKREDIKLFDQAFDLFWRKPPEGELAHLPQLGLVEKHKQILIVPPQPPAAQAERDDSGDDPEDDSQKLIELTRLPSAHERLRNKDFADMSVDELEAIKRMIAQMVWQLGQRRTRRTRSGQGQALDLRRTLRAAMRQGGEWISLARRTPKFKPRPIVVLADISGSMERYSTLLLHFLYALTEGLDQRVECFVFATRLTRVTRALHHREVEEALRRVGRVVRDWSGGTKIGEAIRTFNQQWGRRVLNGGALALVISDGWDCGDPAILSAEMERLRMTTHEVIWLNPLLGAADYTPATRGMRAALPHVHRFLPVHNLTSLEALAEQLALMRV
jgi:hypothetical protein